MDSILISATIFFILAKTTDGHLSPGAKSHYTAAHHSAHRLVRESSTHAHLEDFEIAVPKITDVTGNFITHSIQYASRRTRRSAPNDGSLTYVQLLAYGHKFGVELRPSQDLISPTFAVTRIKRDTLGEIRETEENSDGLDCHYRGKMISHGNKTTAMSTCNGLTGLLRTNEDDFIVEPIPKHLTHNFPSPQLPHIVYKRRHLGGGRDEMHYCGRRKRHPTAISVNNGADVRMLSDGALVFKPQEGTSNSQSTDAFDNGSPSGSKARKERSKRSVWHSEEHGEDEKRRKRRIVETLVVVDQQMIRNHESENVDVTTYVLTVMNMVTGLFKDGTLDGQVDIVLVGLTLLDDDKEVHLDHRADKSLLNFCRWQSRINTTNGRRPDHSILLTGIDICIDKNQPCDTLGLAQIGGMCSSTDSCTINEDMGLGLAFTVAHETGHSFGMKHDGQGNSCSKHGGNIMSPTLNTLNGVFTWSSCSRHSMRDFLKSEQSECLNDADLPKGADLTFPEELPGQIYSADDQCKLQFGADAKLCYFRYHPNRKRICKSLWCQRSDSDGHCETKHLPAVEGTECGKNMWCRRGECVAHGSEGPEPVNGGWAEFGHWSDCTRTCGGGITFRRRRCDNPIPRYGGRHCEGEEKTYLLCNTRECPPSAVDFRSQQCAEYNSRPYRRQFFTWVPYTKYWKYNLNRCELLCKAEGYGFFDMLAPQVKDGTTCDDESDDVCIAGKCVHVGCDRVLNSNAIVDACGTCNGDNTTCRFVNGTFRDDVFDSGYYFVTKIPRGARTIKISEESCCTHTYLSIRSTVDPSRYYLNGDWRVDLYGKVEFAGAKWQYDRQIFQPEILTTEGPIDEDIVIEALIVRSNPGVSYTYALKEIDNTLLHDVNEIPKSTYTWHRNLTLCSASCAGGQQRTVYVCMINNEREVADTFCKLDVKPAPETLKCNEQPCPPRWVIEEWGQCTRTCGGGLQVRRVTCKRITTKGEEYVQPSRCDLSRKHLRTQHCNQHECPAVWKTGVWSQCSKFCGRGVRTRSITCVSESRTVPNEQCDIKLKPNFRQSCLVSYCRRRYQWFITAWGECSTTCGSGIQRRELKCSTKDRNGRYHPVPSRKCRHARRPRISLTSSCSNNLCTGLTTTVSHVTTTASQRRKVGRPARVNTLPGSSQDTIHKSSHTGQWISGSWQQCTTTCGGGKQVRTVKCILRGKPSHSCSYMRKPSHLRPCNTYQCGSKPRHKSEDCVDKFKWCNMVPQHNTCSHRYFGQQCCKSCNT